MAAQPSTSPPKPPQAVSTAGLNADERLKGGIAYILGLITGIVVLLIAGDNKFLKFHGMQSIVASIVIGVIWFILEFILATIWLTWFIMPFFELLFLLVWLYFLYGAYLVYTGRPFRIPYVADFVDQNLVK
jgi:uncharacterized membrane protein